MDAAKKFWTIPELGEKLVSFLDPLSTLRLFQSNKMDEETMQKSLTSKTWSKLIRQSSVNELSRFDSNFEKQKEDVKVLVKILHFVELEELRTFLMLLLDLICETNPGRHLQMICPCRPDPHSISPEGFLLLEEVEGAFGSTEQSLQSIRSFGNSWHESELLLAISSRMSRQKKETVTSIWTCLVQVNDNSSVEAFINLLQGQRVSVRRLNLRNAEFGEEGWQALAGALRGKPKDKLALDQVVISRQQDLTDVRRESIKDIWEATRYGFEVFNGDGSYSQRVDKTRYDWEQAWTRLRQIGDMTEDEFAASCKLEWGEVSDEDTESGGEEEEEEGEEDHDGEEEGDEEEG